MLLQTIVLCLRKRVFDIRRMEQKPIHFNVPQLRASLVDAPISWNVMGRGTGKTEGILAPKSTRLVTGLPRATILIVGATFQQILTRTLPPLILGWERLGYIEGVHYLIGKKPTDKWKRMWGCPGALRPPQRFEYALQWWNGVIMQMVSQDRIGSTNGMSIDAIIGDEAKLLNRDRLHQETFPANRGLVYGFKDNPDHHGMTFTTDMPVGTAGRWILDKEKDADKTVAEQIIKLQVLRLQMQAAGQDVSKIDVAMKKLRRGLVYYQEASTLDNLHALGIQFFRDQLRESSAFEFTTAILNRKPMKLEDGFYPDLDEEKHGYYAYDYTKFHNTGYKLNDLAALDGASVDADYDPKKPLHISLDYNRRITPMVVAQMVKYDIRVIKGIHSLYPLKLDDTLAAFCDYYKYHLKRTVYFWYDHTATAEYSHAGSQCDDVIKYLRSKGWNVVERYLGQAHGHERRYTMYGHLLKEDDTYKFVLRINRDRCEHLLLSLFQSQAIRTKRGFGKDKKPELDAKFPAEEATHYSEALDMLICGILESGMSYEDEYGGGVGFQMIG